jgi:glycosyltransferase involved in cell wall biosynthesis
MIESSMPMVSIGLPTFNRPEGLKRSLDCILLQTYPSLEIIVSDNCSSPEHSIEEIVADYSRKDKRIKYYRQESNIGAFFNFQFVLKKASGEYFMWFADDDFKSPIFIEQMLGLIQNAGGAFGTYAVKNYVSGDSYTYKVPTILSDMPLHQQLMRFLTVFPSVYIYGLFKRKSLDFFLELPESFDFFDGYFAMHVLLKDGLHVKPTEVPITILGLNEKEYVPKPFNKMEGRVFSYSAVIKGCWKLIKEEKRLNFWWRQLSLGYFLIVIGRYYITFEYKYNPIAWVLNYLVRIPLRFIYRAVNKIKSLIKG